MSHSVRLLLVTPALDDQGKPTQRAQEFIDGCWREHEQDAVRPSRLAVAQTWMFAIVLAAAAVLTILLPWLLGWRVILRAAARGLG